MSDHYNESRYLRLQLRYARIEDEIAKLDNKLEKSLEEEELIYSMSLQLDALADEMEELLPRCDKYYLARCTELGVDKEPYTKE